MGTGMVDGGVGSELLPGHKQAAPAIAGAEVGACGLTMGGTNAMQLLMSQFSAHTSTAGGTFLFFT
jgi:hypothetical protein